MFHRRARLGLCVALPAFAALLPVPRASADEGLWTLDNLPLAALEQRYGFRPTREWIEHVQKACVDFGGASGSFVSANGLVLTAHHVALGQLQKLSTQGRDLVHDGFYAKDAAAELRCPDLELSVLLSTEDVTARVRKAFEKGASEKERNALRKAEIARIEQESLRRTKLRSRVVELYHGGEYWLYRSKKYTDVRLVMAPEEQIAFYGGELDNFSYPRHDLDFAFFRVYENGAPVRPERWFRWSATGPKEDELVFVAGHPGSTGRLLTVAQLEYLRDAYLPVRVHQQETRVAALRAFSAQTPEAARRAKDRIRGLDNNLKRQRAFLAILREPAFLEAKRTAEASWRERVAKDPRAAAEAGDAWDRIAAAERELTSRQGPWLYSEISASRLATIAQEIVRYVVEIEKPNGQRLEEYRDSRLESLRFRMFSPAPIWPDADAVALAAQLRDAAGVLRADDPFVKLALGGRPPEDVATSLLQATALGDPSERRRLVEGGRAAVDASTDPLIVWVRALDPVLRELRAWNEDHVESVESLEGGRIARARFALEGRSAYPDATGTLRLSYGRVAGYEQLTTLVPWETTYLGLFDRALSFGSREPFELPARVAAARSRLDLATPLNFVSTDDIIGGNSGSPIVSADLECVGVVFDGNTQGFLWNYAYDDAQARCVSVHSAGILEALRHIYDMSALADELTGASQSGSTATAVRP
ncbi:MAG: S46 family peptidase [bacterium]